MQILEILRECADNGSLIAMELTGRRAKEPGAPDRVKIRPVRAQGESRFQIESFFAQKATQVNLELEAFLERAKTLISEFRQGRLFTVETDYLLITNKRGEVQLKSSPPTRMALDTTHDRRKTYLIPENQPCDFLVKLGVMRADGKVLAHRYDKFRQINRFLEMAADTVSDLPSGELRIIDFGCGKSYLTFALYYYLVRVLNRKATIIGVDQKSDVVAHCESLARELNYDGLRFIEGEIKESRIAGPVDMMVSLHACDTATDDALAQALRWETKVILSVPCCQHELFRQMRNDSMRPLLKHGVLKERLSALLTDAIRGELLERAGYSVQILEFIEMEHTAKNLLIRAVRKPGSPEKTASSDYEAFRDFWGVNPTLEALISDLNGE